MIFFGEVHSDNVIELILKRLSEAIIKFENLPEQKDDKKLGRTCFNSSERGQEDQGLLLYEMENFGNER